MKKIDLHIHTIATISDSYFDFSIDTFSTYVNRSGLDAVAVTNHNVFDCHQFIDIRNALGIKVFPGIEINFFGGHLLLIDEGEDVDAFTRKTDMVTDKIQEIGDYLTNVELVEIFGELNNYLIIPHYEKSPPLNTAAFGAIAGFIEAGEVDSAKKFIRCVKDDGKLTPVLFSDARISDDMQRFPTRQTYVDCGDLSVTTLKECLRDKTKVALSPDEGNKLFSIFDDGQRISTGLNILLGERSSGKTHTLNRISKEIYGCKYIRQFSLVQQDDGDYERKFDQDLTRRKSVFIDSYLAEFKAVLNDIGNVVITDNHARVEKYIRSLLKSAEEVERRDAYSNTVLFSETEFEISQDEVLIKLIESVRQLIENIEYRDVIEKHLDLSSLRKLACELMEALWEKALLRNKRVFVNEMIRDVKQGLRIRTSATQVEEVDLYSCALDDRKVAKFESVAKELQKESVISEEHIQGFRIIARKGPFLGAGEIKIASGLRTAFSTAYYHYHSPYFYLLELRKNDALSPSEYFKYFAKFTYEILNRDGFGVSGGERSEFRLLQEINDSQNHDILLIDEPESSFDNIFLKEEVNEIIKDISKVMPVIVVTHNATVGASIKPDYILYASKEMENGTIAYRLYSGYPTDKQLVSTDGKTLGNFDITLNALEAGSETYEERRVGYEAIKD